MPRPQPKNHKPSAWLVFRWGRAPSILVSLAVAAWGGLIAYLRRDEAMQLTGAAILAITGLVMAVLAWRRNPFDGN